MPDGFEKQMSEEDLVNLLEFLTQRGKYLPLPLDKVATVVTTKGMFYSETADGGAADLRRLVAEDVRGCAVPADRSARRPGEERRACFIRPSGKIPPTMPKSVKLPCNMPGEGDPSAERRERLGLPGQR